MTKNNITALKEEELDNVQGGSVSLLLSAFLAGVATAAAIINVKYNKK